MEIETSCTFVSVSVRVQVLIACHARIFCQPFCPVTTTNSPGRYRQLNPPGTTSALKNIFAWTRSNYQAETGTYILDFYRRPDPKADFVPQGFVTSLESTFAFTIRCKSSVVSPSISSQNPARCSNFSNGDLIPLVNK